MCPLDQLWRLSQTEIRQLPSDHSGGNMTFFKKKTDYATTATKYILEKQSKEETRPQSTLDKF